MPVDNSLTVGSLFSGIGGFDLGFERAGFRVIWQVENDAYCNRVLAKHWPEVKRYGDIKAIDWGKAERPNIVIGGFPCQPVSVAGKRKAQQDERWLWPEFARCLRVLRPDFAVVENVPGLLTAGFGDVLGDLAALGYNAEWDCVSAFDVGAPHLRKRIFVVAYRDRERCDVSATVQIRIEGAEQSTDYNIEKRENGNIAVENMGMVMADAEGDGKRPGLRTGEPRGERRGRPGNGGGEVPDAGSDGLALNGKSPESKIFCGIGRGISPDDGREFWSTEPDVGRVAHGIPSRVDRLKGLGNAVVPQVAEYVARLIKDSITP